MQAPVEVDFTSSFSEAAALVIAASQPGAVRSLKVKLVAKELKWADEPSPTGERPVLATQVPARDLLPPWLEDFCLRQPAIDLLLM